MSIRSALFSKSRVFVALLAGVSFASLAYSGSEPLPPNAKFQGMSLTQWQDTYWRFYYGGEGDEVVGHTVLLPLPDASGDGTPAEIDVALDPGQAFVLPLWGWVGTSYHDATPPDPKVAISVFQTLKITLIIDGEKVVTNKNVMDYYVQGDFAPPIPLDFSASGPPFDNIKAAIWFQDIIIAHNPLSKGQHKITLDVVNTQPAFDSLTEYHNTWNITVGNPGK